MGLKDRPVVRTVLAVQKRFGRDDGSYLAASVAYYGFLSIFPLILLGLAVIGFVLADEPAVQREWVGRLSSAIPGLGPLIGDSLDAVVASRGSATAVGVLALLWSGTRITEAASRAMSVVFGVPAHESFISKKGWSLLVTAGLGSLALTGFAVAALATAIEAQGLAGAGLSLAGALVAFAIDFALFMVGYRVLVRRPGPPFPRLWPGALFAAVAWSLLKLGGTWLAASQVERATAVYGAFAVTVGALLLLYLAAQIFLYGAELNAVLIERGGGSVQEEARSPTNGRTDYDQWPTGKLVKSIAGEAATLVRKEVELAKQEVTEGITGKIKGIAGLVVAGLLALLGVAFLGEAAARALDLVLAPWLSRIIVAAVFLLIAGLGLAWGASTAKRGSVTATETRRTVKEDVEWARDQLKR